MSNNRKNMVLVKDKTGHYKYVSPTKANLGSRLYGFIFKLAIVLIILVCVYAIYIDIFDVMFYDEAMSIEVGSKEKIELLPKNSFFFEYTNYVYNIENKSIANIDSNGDITAYSVGTTTISVRYKYSFITKKTKLEVIAPEVENEVEEDINNNIIIDNNLF